MRRPKVSVIILTYNRHLLLRKAILSVLNQTFQDFEIIVIDDASKEETRFIMDEFTDERIRYFRHNVNKGEGCARNTGLKYVKGKYIAFLDDDDEWLPEKLDLQVTLLKGSPEDVGVVYTGCMRVNTVSGEVLGVYIPQKRGDIFRELLTTNFVIPSSVLMKKECLEKVGMFDESIDYGLDYDMWIRISREFKFECIKKPLIKYSINQGRLSTKLDIQIRGREKILEKYGDFFASVPKDYSHHYFMLGMLHFCNGNITEGRKASFKAIQLYPFSLKPYLATFLSLIGTYAVKKTLVTKVKIRKIFPH